MKVYISGPITDPQTGKPAENARELFAQAERQVASFGHEPVNPFNNGLSDDSTYEEHLCRDIFMLLGCDAIYLLKNWNNSMGARIEANIATERGMEILHQPDFTEFSSRM